MAANVLTETGHNAGFRF